MQNLGPRQVGEAEWREREEEESGGKQCGLWKKNKIEEPNFVRWRGANVSKFERCHYFLNKKKWITAYFLNRKYKLFFSKENINFYQYLNISILYLKIIVIYYFLEHLNKIFNVSKKEKKKTRFSNFQK